MSDMYRGVEAMLVAQNISDALNELWDPAWNVVVAELADPSQVMVCYGYAYKSHWAWYNIYKGSEYAFALWKDYNCGIWVGAEKTGEASGQPAYWADVAAAGSNNMTASNNIWVNTKIKVEESELNQNLGVQMSGVGINGVPVRIGSRVCLMQMSGTGYYYTTLLNNQFVGFVFPTRSGNYRA